MLPSQSRKAQQEATQAVCVALRHTASQCSSPPPQPAPASLKAREARPRTMAPTRTWRSRAVRTALPTLPVMLAVWAIAPHSLAAVTLQHKRKAEK